MRLKLACQEHLIPGDDLVSKWKVASSAGFDGIELHGHGDLAFEKRLEELMRARDAGVVMPTVCVIMDHFIGDFDEARRRDALDNMKSLLSVIAEIGGYGAITPASYGMFSTRLPPYHSPRSPEKDREVLMEGLTELGAHAAESGVFVLVEPLNRYEDHMLNSLAHASELCAAVGSDAVRVMGDLFHMNMEEDDVAESIRAARGHLAHIHLADSNREHPGTGHVDFGAALSALGEIGFDGWMAMECGLRGEPQRVLANTASLLRSLAPTGS